MGKNLNRFVASVVILWIAVFIFQKEVLAFIGGWNPSWFKDVLLQVVNFMVYWAGRGWDLMKEVFNYFVGLATKIVSNADPLYGLVKWLADIISSVIKFIVDLFYPLVGKFFAR